MSRKCIRFRFSYLELVTVIVAMTLISSLAKAEDPPAVVSLPVTKQVADVMPQPTVPRLASTTSGASKKIGTPNLLQNQGNSSPALSSSSAFVDRLENNVTARATHRMVKVLMEEKEVSSQRSIQEYVMGSYSTGSALTTGKIVIEFLPSSDRGLLDIHFTGQ